jgi:hypothetical protein
VLHADTFFHHHPIWPDLQNFTSYLVIQFWDLTVYSFWWDGFLHVTNNGGT